MSSSDYTCMRRIRHMNHQSCNTQPIAVSCVPPTYYNHTGYVQTPSCHPPCPPHQHPHEHPHEHAHEHPHRPLPQHHHHHHQGGQHAHYPPQPIINNNVSSTCNCTNCAPPPPPTPQYQHYPVVYNQYPDHACYNTMTVASQPVVYKGCGGGDMNSSTVKPYLLTPVQCGSVTFTIDTGLGFSHGTRVACNSTDLSGNYFEGIVYDYNTMSGEITLYEIKYISGAFNAPMHYAIMAMAASKEIDLLRERMEAVYKKVFNIDLSQPACGTGTGTGGGGDGGDGDAATASQNTNVANLYKYFFNTDITTEADYALTQTYLTTKMAYLYNYFFDVDISTNTSFNPNGNGTALSTLDAKISQLYLYFFNNDLSGGDIAIV